MKEAFINAMVTAIEGGSEYWCAMIGFYNADGKHMSYEDWFETGKTIRVHDGEDAHTETRGAFFANVERYFPDWKEMFSDEGDYDAADADQFLQLGVFGEVIFG